jgi:hypothetical protein
MAPSVVTTGTSNSRKQTRVAACAAAVAALTAGFLVSTAGSAQAIATAVPLHTAESFAVLAGSGITNTGTTTIDGDVGASPTGTVTLNGPIILVPPSVYHQADAVADQAKTDLVTGYNNAAGQARDADSGGELGGQTLVAGVYGTDSTLGLTGTVTLDGGGRTDGVWVFQVGSGVTTASSSSVSLTNGAQACNVYWQVGSSATLGTSTAFVGTILANTSITATTGATIEGRLLASGGAVTLDSNTITKPGCLTTTQDAEVSASDASSEASASSAAAVQSAADTAQSAADQATSAAAEAAAAQAQPRRPSRARQLTPPPPRPPPTLPRLRRRPPRICWSRHRPCRFWWCRSARPTPVMAARSRGPAATPSRRCSRARPRSDDE